MCHHSSRSLADVLSILTAYPFPSPDKARIAELVIKLKNHHICIRITDGLPPGLLTFRQLLNQDHEGVPAGKAKVFRRYPAP